MSHGSRCLGQLLCLLLGSGPTAEAAGRVVMVSFDGLGHEILTRDPAAVPLRAFAAVRRAGTTFQGVQPHFPSTTPNSHAAIYTGVYGDVSGISFPEIPRWPRPEHGFRERLSGFRSDGLRAEPIWVTAARQGKRVVAHQVTQAYPFRPENTQRLAVVVNGYQTETIAPWTLTAVVDGTVWQSGPYRFQFHLGGSGGHVRLLPDGPSVPVKAAPMESSPPRNRRLARFFSPMLALPGERPLGVHFRLFDRAGSLRLLQTSIQELALHDGAARNDGLVRELLQAVGAFTGNGAMLLHSGGQLTAEEYLETVEFQIQQATAHAAWLERRFQPQLFLGYLPFPDETDHTWLGRDRFGDATARRYRGWAYEAINRGAEVFAGLAGRADSLLFVSDHGMTPVRHMVNMRVLLEEHGLADLVAYLSQAFLVNGEEWRGGRVAGEDQPGILDRLRRALLALRDPESGDPVVTGIYSPAEHSARYGIGGPVGGDLYFDLAPGWMAGYSGQAPLVSPIEPYGTHGFLPTRPDMLAIALGRGPQFAPGAEYPQIRAVALAPLVAELLGIAPPPLAKEPSPLALRRP